MEGGKPGFFLPVRVLSRLFRRRFLEELTQAQSAGQLRFFGEFAGLADAAAFAVCRTGSRPRLFVALLDGGRRAVERQTKGGGAWPRVMQANQSDDQTPVNILMT